MNTSEHPRPGSADRPLPPGLEQINLNAAGIDIGSSCHFVAVPPDRDQQPVRRFGSFTADLHEIARWLHACGITTVAMESTGVYWIALFQILERAGFEVLLVNAAHVKNVPGRKSDVLDCQWLQQLHTYGLLRGCFRPDDQTCVLRSYMRQRQMLVTSASRQLQHMHKALTQMNIQLHQVLSDISGSTGMAIIRAIVAGERDPIALARLRDPRVKSSEQQIAKALEGDWRAEHLFALKQAVELYDVYQQKIGDCDQLIQQQLLEYPEKADPTTTPPPPSKKRRRGLKGKGSADEQTRTALYRAVGVDLSTIDGLDARTIEAFVAEIGVDVQRFPSEKHFGSWLNLSPHPQISGEKVLAKRPSKRKNRAGQVLRMAAANAMKSNSALGAFARRQRARLGRAKAVKATAYRIAKLIYRALRYGTHYADIGQAAYDAQFRQRQLASLNRNAQRLGLTLVPAAA